MNWKFIKDTARSLLFNQEIETDSISIKIGQENVTVRKGLYYHFLGEFIFYQGEHPSIPENVRGRVTKITQHYIYVTTTGGENKLTLDNVKFSHIEEYAPTSKKLF